MAEEQSHSVSTMPDTDAASITTAQRVLRGRSGVVTVGIVSFVESGLPFPILTDPFFIAAIMLHRENVVRLWLVTTITSVLGGLFAYWTATLFLTALLAWLPTDTVVEFQQIVESTDQSSAFMLTLIGAVTPVPYTLAAYAVAALQGGIVPFITASLLGRAGRYLVVGYSVYRFGPLAMQYIRKYIGLISFVLVAAVLAYVWLHM